MCSKRRCAVTAHGNRNHGRRRTGGVGGVTAGLGIFTRSDSDVGSGWMWTVGRRVAVVRGKRPVQGGGRRT